MKYLILLSAGAILLMAAGCTAGPWEAAHVTKHEYCTEAAWQCDKVDGDCGNWLDWCQ